MKSEGSEQESSIEDSKETHAAGLSSGVDQIKVLAESRFYRGRSSQGVPKPLLMALDHQVAWKRCEMTASMLEGQHIPAIVSQWYQSGIWCSIVTMYICAVDEAVNSSEYSGYNYERVGDDKGDSPVNVEGSW